VWLSLGSRLYRLGYDGSTIGQRTLPGTIRRLTFDPQRSLLWATTTAGFSILRAPSAEEEDNGASPILTHINVPITGGAMAVDVDSIHDGAWIGTPTALERYDPSGQLQQSTVTTFAPFTALAADGTDPDSRYPPP
jgi:hypothetical protein